MEAIRVKDVVEIPNCGLYAKSPKALKALFKELKRKGYEIEDCSVSKGEPGSFGHRPPRKVQEKEGWSLWFAKLKDNICQPKGKCGSCHKYIDTAGIRSHKHKCELCGAYTYREYIDGSIVRFKFISDERVISEPTLKMKVFDYDDKLGCLLLYRVPEDGNGFNDCTTDKAADILVRNRDKFTHVERGGNDFLAIRYNPYSGCIEPDAVISMYEVWNDFWNHKIVKLYDGKEYGEHDTLPIPETYNIYEAWHWAPLKPSPKLHEKIIHAAGMVSDCGYYYQDGRTAFYDIHLRRMRLFVEHFTTISLKEWDKMIAFAPKSGPGMIKAIATFCYDSPEIENRPNVGNLLVGTGKILEGQKLTHREKVAMADALKDSRESQKFFDIFGRVLPHKRK